MTGTFCTVLMDGLINYLTGGGTFTAPTHLYVGLANGAITAAGGVTGEPSGNGYARPDAGVGTSNWNASSSGSASNKLAITFAQNTSSDWGLINNFFVADHLTLTTGHVLFYGALTTPKTITVGDTASFAASALTVSIT
jgi:hypothetical protein